MSFRPDSGESEIQGDTPLSFFLHLEALMLGAERSIAMLQHFSPRNFGTEVARLVELLDRGESALPSFVYASVENSALRSAGEQLLHVREQLAVSSRDTGSSWSWLSELMERRVEELLLEFQLVQARGTSQVVELARQRFQFSGEEQLAAFSLASSWLEHLETESLSASDQVIFDEVSLASEFLARARREGLHVPIIERDMPSIAAVGGHCLYIQRGARTSSREAARIWIHEVGAHLLPRLAADRAPPPFRIGTAEANEDEEGRAILLEERAELLSSSRKQALAVRHVLAVAVRESEEQVVLTARHLIARGVSSKTVANAMCRTCRGGGLGREVIYLTSFVRVSRGLSAAPQLEDWMKRGRISLQAAQVLSRHWSMP